MHRLCRHAALVDVDLTAAAAMDEGAVVEDKQGNVYIVFHDCSSREDVVENHLTPWLDDHGHEYVALAGFPWTDDEDWAWLTFKDLIAYDPDTGEAAVCFNYPKAEEEN